MIEMLLAIAPIFLLIVLGHALRRGGIPNIEFWNLNDKLVYWVLFPALLFYNMATMELSGEVLTRAGQPFPVEPVRTLDAIHLATALVFTKAYPDLQILTFDQRISNNAQPLGIA